MSDHYSTEKHDEEYSMVFTRTIVDNNGYKIVVKYYPDNSLEITVDSICSNYSCIVAGVNYYYKCSCDLMRNVLETADIKVAVVESKIAVVEINYKLFKSTESIKTIWKCTRNNANVEKVAELSYEFDQKFHKVAVSLNDVKTIVSELTSKRALMDDLIRLSAEIYSNSNKDNTDAVCNSDYKPIYKPVYNPTYNFNNCKFVKPYRKKPVFSFKNTNESVYDDSKITKSDDSIYTIDSDLTLTWKVNGEINRHYEETFAPSELIKILADMNKNVDAADLYTVDKYIHTYMRLVLASVCS